MPKNIFVIIIIIATLFRFYTLFFMTKKQKKGTVYHKWSYPLLLTTYNISFWGAVYEYFHSSIILPANLNYLGTVIMFTGIFITGLATKAVNTSWSQHIELKSEHKVCTSGPYKYMRHPYYFGVTLELVGACLMASAYYAFLFLILIHTPFVLFRANLEEKVMLKNLSGYKKYKETCKLFI
jgi:methyltransferase